MCPRHRLRPPSPSPSQHRCPRPLLRFYGLGAHGSAFVSYNRAETRAPPAAASDDLPRTNLFCLKTPSPRPNPCLRSRHHPPNSRMISRHQQIVQPRPRTTSRTYQPQFGISASERTRHRLGCVSQPRPIRSLHTALHLRHQPTR